MKGKDSITSHLSGKILTRRIDENTGSVLDESDFFYNTILNTSRDVFILAVLNGQGKNKIDIIKLGLDMGNGNSSTDSDINPEDENSIVDPTPEVIANDEIDYVFSKSVDDFSFYSQDATKRMKFYARFSGEEIIDYYEKNQPNIDRLAALPITSASLYSKENIGFSYKRFPGRYVMRGISLEIEWIIDWEEF